MRVLVTGGTGFIGSHATAALLAAGHEVRLLARDPSKVDRVLGPRGIEPGEVVPGDMGDAASVWRALKGCDAVLHAAAAVGVASGDLSAVAGNVGRGYRRGRLAMKRARKGRAPEDFHDWRKRAKDLRYQLEILGPHLPSDFDGIRTGATDLAEQLGDLHDLDVLADDLANRDLEPEDRSRLAGLIADARDRQIDSCLKVGEETYSLKPGRFTNRVGESLSDGV